jgi:hypothetical protein
MRQTIMALVAGIALVLSIMSVVDSSETLGAKKYEKNQAATQTNSCGGIGGGSHLKGYPDGSTTGAGTLNGDSGVTFCQNIDSHIQGDDNTAALAGVQQ